MKKKGFRYLAVVNIPYINVSSNENNTGYTLAFKDNSIDISEEHNRLNIFNLFTRLHAKSDYAGTGMGLATYKKITYIYYDKIWVESSQGVDSFFYFAIPKNKSNEK